MHPQQSLPTCSNTFLRRIDEMEHILRERIALLPGVRDRDFCPLIFCPARDVAANVEHIRNLLLYLYDVTEDAVKSKGFVFVIDMRKGTSWDIVKPILKSLQEYFPAKINSVYIIKPEKFIDKYKISKKKYTKFDLQMVSADALTKYIDYCQIPKEFGGSFKFDYDEWIEFRRDIERIVHRISEILKNLDRISFEMSSAEMPIDALSAKNSVQTHSSLFPILTAAPIEEFERDILSIQERLCGEKNGMRNQYQQNGSNCAKNPDLIAVIPHLIQLLKTLVKIRNEVLCDWENRKTELDQYSQLKLFEQDAENLSQWICKHFNNLTHRFVLIGENEVETNRLLKEHLDFAESVNKIEVSYTQVLTIGNRLLQIQPFGLNKIEDISKQLKSDWNKFLTRIGQRTQLLMLASSAYKKCNLFLKNVDYWKTNVGEDPNKISLNDLPIAAKKHLEFQKIYKTSWIEANEELQNLAKFLKKYFGESLNQLPIASIIQEKFNLIGNSFKGINSVWEARDMTIKNKLSSAEFITDLNSVLDWLNQHGEPFLNRKTGIGVDPESASILTQNHQKFRAVAINTFKNADQIFRVKHVLDDADVSVRNEAIKKVDELHYKIEKFKRCTEHRTHLLHLAYYFYLHYNEIMDWYEKMDSRANYVCIVPESVENCEKNKETFQKDNDLTVQAYDRVMIEAQQLLQSLNLQSEYLEIDNSESVNHVQQLTKDIENRHLLEKERWKEQRIYLNTAFKISTFLRDCFEIKKQLESWRQDLQGLKQTDSNTVEKIKHYHTQNTVKVQYVVSDAMKQLDEILELIQSKNLRMVYASDTNIPVQETLISAARQLQNLEQDVMNIAKDISNRIELSIHLNKLRQLSIEIIDSIERQQLRYHQYYNNIPGNEQETNLATKYFNEFRLEIELIEEKISTFYNEKERFTSLPLLALDYHAETRVQAENLLTDVKAKWQGLVGLIDIRYKTLTSANSYYKYTKLLLPTSQSIEKDLLADNEGDFCKLGDWTSLEHCQEAMSERLEKHKSHKERFLQASVYAQKTADQFIKCMRSCKAPREHVDMRIFEVQKYKETIRERQTIILCLWKECNAKIEKCKLCVKIKISAKNIIDWSDRELATCVLVIENVEKAKKVDVSTRRKMLDDLLNKCLEEKDLMKVERYHLRTMLKEAKEFLEAFPSDFHSFEVDKYSSLAKTKLQNIWSMLTKSEQTIKNELNLLNGKNLIELDKNECCLDRYSDSTIEDKLTKKEEEPNKKINEPMKELLKSEADYIEDLRRCIEIYLFSYKTAGSMCPLSIRGKEKEIFGNIEEIYQFHSKIFLSELHTYEQNPEDVGYCFIAWMEKLKELYADYCLNNEANAYLIGLPEAKEMFREVREQNNLELCHELQSLVIKPVQRVAKYHVLLNEIFKHSTKNTKEIKNAYEIVLSIPKLANDRMHLKNFEDYQKYNVGDFVMQDTFLVSEPKRYFKREREFQIFLFESNIIFTKREELNSKKIGYVFKDSMLLRELHVVEHIEADNTKFGLRKSAFPYQNDQNTTVLKANTEAQRILWVKTLRDLKMDIGRHKSGGGGGGNNSDNSNRASRDSQSSLILQSVVTTTALAQLPLEDGYCSLQSVDSFNTFSSNGNVILRQIKNEENQQQQQQYCEFEQLEFEEKQTTTTYIATEDFIASKPDQLNILTGQKVEILANNEEEEEENEFIKIAILDKFGNRVVEGGNEGFVPKRILMQIVEGGQPIASTSNFNDDAATTSSNNNKRTSIRRFFTSSSQKGESKCQQQQRSSPSGAILRPKSSSTTIDQNLTINNNNNKNNNKILSPSTKIKQQQKGEEEEEETCLNNNNNDLLDLPPPMDQLGEKGGEVKENGQLENESSPPIENNNNTTESSAIPETSNSTAPPQMNAEETCRLKRSYVLQELVETERAYVVDLTSIVDGYIATLKEMELSDEDREKVKIIFANIEQILDFHKSVFCKEIEKCLEDYEAAGNAFIKYERRLHTFYVKYCQNKPKSDFLVSQDNFEQLLLDVKDRLGHKVSINDLLIKPVQRITKYQLMLSDILKYTHRANDRAEILERAHDVMRVVPKACDDMMQVGRLQGFQGNLTAQGRLIFQGTLIISDGNINQPFKGKERRVFLFEQSVIIAECIPPRKEYGNPLYNFKNQIMVNKMVLEENFIDEPLRFVLQSNDPNQPATFVAQSSSMEDKEQWLNKLSAQLDQQKTFLAALVDPKRYLANSMGSMNISGKKDSSGSLGTPTSPGVNSIGGGIPSSGSNTSGAISPTKPKATQQKSSGSKLFGFG